MGSVVPTTNVTSWDETVISIKWELFHIEKHVSKQKLQPETIENVYMRKKPIDIIIKMICTFPSMINLKMMQILFRMHEG